MLTGRVPFQGASDYAVLKAHVEEHPAPPSVAMPGLPPWLDRAILKALAKAPAERFQTVEDLRLCLQGQGAAAAAAPTFVIPAADQPTLHMAPTVAAARPPSAPATPATPPATRFATPSPAPATPPPAPMPPSSPARAQTVSRAAHPGWGGRRRRSALLVAGALAALVAAAVLYRSLAAPPLRPRAPNAGTAAERPAGSAGGPVTTGNAALPRGVPGGAGGPGGIGGIGGSRGAGTKGTGGTGAGGTGQRGTSASGAATGTGGTSTGGAATGADGTSARGAEPRARGKRARLGGGDAPSSTRRAGAPDDAPSSTAPAGRQASGEETDSAGGKDGRAASATGAGGGSTAGGAPDDELRQLGSELEPESDQIRNLYADFLSQKDKDGSRLTDSDDKLKDELKDLQRAVDGFRVQFQTGLWARTRKGFGRLSHSEDQKAQVARVARALVGSAERVEALMAQVKPDPAVRDLWRRIHRQCLRIAEICGL